MYGAAIAGWQQKKFCKQSATLENKKLKNVLGRKGAYREVHLSGGSMTTRLSGIEYQIAGREIRTRTFPSVNPKDKRGNLILSAR